jgi:uncharacterized RmlC-like cupin family protein
MSDVRVVRVAELSEQTSQTRGMHRLAAIDAKAGSRNLWVGFVTLDPGARSGPHHHGDCESVICMTSGRMQLRYGDRLEKAVEAGPGDYVYVPPRVVHQEINLSDSEAIESIVVRDSQENVVVNVDVPGA